MNALILRCQPSKTKKLLEWGNACFHGMFWAPATMRRRRLPRSRKQVEVLIYALPGYIFLKSTDDREALTGALDKGMRLMRTAAASPATCSLVDLAVMNKQLQKVAKVEATLAVNMALPSPQFSKGQQVVAISGPLSSIKGEVVAQNGDEVTIETASFWGTLKISSFLLMETGRI